MSPLNNYYLIYNIKNIAKTMIYLNYKYNKKYKSK